MNSCGLELRYQCCPIGVLFLRNGMHKQLVLCVSAIENKCGYSGAARHRNFVIGQLPVRVRSSALHKDQLKYLSSLATVRQRDSGDQMSLDVTVWRARKVIPVIPFCLKFGRIGETL